jgi:hypothetical protein
MQNKWMLLIYACYRPMRLTVHTIIYWCMLHMLSIGNTLQQWYQAMMHHCLNIDVLCMFISDQYYIRCQSIPHFTLIAVVNCDQNINLDYFVTNSSSASASAYVTVPTVSTTRLRLQMSLKSCCWHMIMMVITISS